MKILRNTLGPELASIIGFVNALVLTAHFATLEDPAIANGATAGKLKTVNAVDYTVAGVRENKAATDDLWDLTGETTNGAAEFRAYWLYVDASGTATIDGGTAGTDEASALAKLPDFDETQSVIGVYIGGVDTDYTLALAAQGTIHDGIPAGVPGMPDRPEFVKLVAP